jgi:hypothetical protein
VPRRKLPKSDPAPDSATLGKIVTGLDPDSSGVRDRVLWGARDSGPDTSPPVNRRRPTHYQITDLSPVGFGVKCSHGINAIGKNRRQAHERWVKKHEGIEDEQL